MKPDFRICENKGANAQLINAFVFATEIAQPPFFLKSEMSNTVAIFCACTAAFVSDLIRIPEDRFSHDPAHL